MGDREVSGAGEVSGVGEVGGAGKFKFCRLIGAVSHYRSIDICFASLLTTTVLLYNETFICTCPCNSLPFCTGSIRYETSI